MDFFGIILLIKIFKEVNNGRKRKAEKI